MRIRLRDPSLLDDLRQHFTRAGFVVEEGGDSVNVLPPTGSDPERGNEDARVLLMVWRAMHPRTIAEPPD
jgi:hypothetical protein